MTVTQSLQPCIMYDESYPAAASLAQLLCKQLHRILRVCYDWVGFMQELRGNFDIDVRVLGIMSSRRMLLSESSIDLANWKQHFQE